MEARKDFWLICPVCYPHVALRVADRLPRFSGQFFGRDMEGPGYSKEETAALLVGFEPPVSGGLFLAF